MHSRKSIPTQSAETSSHRRKSPEDPTPISRDALAELDISQLRSRLSDIDRFLTECDSVGASPKLWEIESCYVRRELESRLPQRQGRHEAS